MSMREKKTKDYLTTIRILSVYGPVRGAYIAREMKLSRPTVSVALRKLVEDGYITVDSDHLIRLTPKGDELAREAMQKTAQEGGSPDGRHGENREASGSGESGLTAEQAIRWLEKERASEIAETILILSKRYYAVRGIDIALFLDSNRATVRAKLRRMEEGGYVTQGTEGTVQLTEFGARIAEQLYARRAPGRERLMKQGRTIREAEQEALRG